MTRVQRAQTDGQLALNSPLGVPEARVRGRRLLLTAVFALASAKIACYGGAMLSSA